MGAIFLLAPLPRIYPLSLKCAYLPLCGFYKKNFHAKVFSCKLLLIFDYIKNSILNNPWATNLKNPLTEILKNTLFSFIMKNLKDSTKFVITKNIQINILHLKSLPPCPTPHPLKNLPLPPRKKSIFF